MFKNYFIVGWRNITRRPFYSSLNILGICTGILFTLLIGVYVWGELQVNRKLRHAKNQYFLISDWKDPNEGINIGTLGPLAKRLKEEYPGLVANYYRGDFVTSIISKGDVHFRESIDIGDSTLLSMYGFELLHGNAATAMKNPYSVVIRKEIALKYFGRTNVVGEKMRIQSFSNTVHDFLITGVLKDIPENSVTDLNIENHHKLFIPANTFSYFSRNDRDNWENVIVPSFIELKEGVTPKDLAGPIKRLMQKNAQDWIRQDLTVRPVALENYYLQKDNGLVQRMLYALSFVGIFILLMAVVNFINISISGSSARIKEIGIRKVLGGLRKQIIVQFLTESVILVLLSTLLALLLYPLARPLFEELIGKEMARLSSFPLYFMLFPSALVLLVGLAAGFYPAIVLSSLKSADSIKGKLKTIRKNISLQRALAGFQFCLASIVMVAALIVTQQVSYFFSQDLGYDQEHVVSSQVSRDWTAQGVRRLETIRNEFAAIPEISKATLSYEIPDGMNGNQWALYRAGQDSTKAVGMQLLGTDEHYLETYQVPMKAGEFLTAATAMDSTKIVINESAAKALGWTNAREALGGQVKFPGFEPICTITGITGDFHFNSMQQKIPPIVFIHLRLYIQCRYISFKLRPGNTANAITAIEKKWAVLLPGSSFEYRFMDETLKRLYRSEIQLKKAAYTATLLSLIIVLLGVIGLVSLSIQKRTKEIGIRKVLGASLTSIMTLFIRDFLLVIILSTLIACPVAWFIMHQWLNNYAYRILVTPLPFIISVLAVSIITVALIAIQTLKAGNANPVKSLKME
ncbi:MAG TPA: ABC transporter permease [Puia sp.]|nr:ABC transporter permease [Puia sp.]